ncbi:hypothetical protein CN514_08500 [Bacillus sp. AFS001701]|uniref:hypothetical protein n=1 Tax=Bacillus sp. AFS001701 TaxID=2033480 RepID=UPI000BF3F2CE|nr:hypothetical protein [Bacillus sp. AFS001701]PET69664.1 hypothetical protein CN514_08500 [Bacillus sp. AFS001701]
MNYSPLDTLTGCLKWEIRDSWEQSILTSDSLPAEVTFIYQANPEVPTVWFHLTLGETYSACFLLRGITVVLFVTLEWYRRMTTTRRVLFTQQALHLNSFFFYGIYIIYCTE